MHKLKVISGGQTGTDQLALEVAFTLGMSTGGVAAPGYQTSVGKDIRLYHKYGLTELEAPVIKDAKEKINYQFRGQGYIDRSKLNVDNSDATLAFRFEESPGTDGTIQYCIKKEWGKLHLIPDASKKEYYRPCFYVNEKALEDDEINNTVARIKNFLTLHKVKILNVCGHREIEKETTKLRMQLVLYRVFLENDL
jgi:hypothetical protein